MHGWALVVYGVVCFGMAIFTGIAGGGAGFVMTPLAIFLGLSPAQAVSTAKLNGLAVTLGSLTGMKQAHGKVSKARVLPIMLLAFAVGLIVPHIIKSLESGFYQVTLGVILLLMVPVVVLKKIGIKPHHPKLWQKYVGGTLLAAALFLQGVFSGGVGTLVNIVLMSMLGMTALEANITKRWSQVILNITIVAGIFSSGLIIWHVAAVGVPANIVGSYIGGKLAVLKGDAFIVRIMVLFMLASGVALILTA